MSLLVLLGALPCTLVGVILLAMAYTLVVERINWRRYSHIPGPKPVSFFGNLPDFLKGGAVHSMQRWAQQYGPVYNFWLGPRHFVTISDPDAARSVMYKCINHAPFGNPGFQLARGMHRQMDEFGLVQAKDNLWRLVRNAWQPAFSSGSLAGYSELMNQSAQQLAGQLGRIAAGGGYVDIFREIGKMTLAVVGTSAYGVDFHTLDETAAGQGPPAGTALEEACKDFFLTMGASGRSLYAIVISLVPVLLPAVRVLAYALPDKNFARHTHARQVILDVGSSLITDWKVKHHANGKSANGPAPVLKAGQGVAPGSFLDLMLAARDKATGEALTDVQVAAQANTFILAGYETTANALAFAIYLLGSNPEVEAKLLAELDAFGRDRPVTTNDLDKLPYLDACIQEVLRLYPPAHGTTRLTDKPMQVCGYDIPVGSSLLLPIYTLHRDPKLWPRPLDFLPERFLPGADASIAASHPHAYLPFGSGSRMCIGFKFALQEAKVTLCRLYQRFRFELQPGQEEMEVTAGITMAPKNGVWVKVHERG